MTKIPSTVVIHKRMDSMDTRLMRMKGEIVHNPLEQNLGLFDFGSYHQADPNAPYAFERVNQIWQEDIDTDESDNEEFAEQTDEESTDDKEEKTLGGRADRNQNSSDQEEAKEQPRTTRRSRKKHD
jgi:hypothetical protein